MKLPADELSFPFSPCYTTDLQIRRKFAEQEKQFARAFSLLEDAIRQGAFPAASVAVLSRGELIAQRAFGRYTYDPSSSLVSPASIFDVASISKVIATTTAVAMLYERGTLDLDSTVPSRPDLSIRRLLTHTSGLPSYMKLFEQTRDRDELIRLAYATPLEAQPGTRTEYSDIGFIILGDVVEKIAGEPLDHFCKNQVFVPLELQDTQFNPPADLRSRTVPTADDQYFRHRLIQGEVHDENAWVMKGVAGHAGVFSTAYDLACVAHCWLSGGAPILKPETVAAFTRQQTGTLRALGWDRPSQPSSSGHYFSASSFGHLGFTGTSLWCDPERQLAIVLLTNRTWPDAKNQAIKQIRPRFHDMVVESL